MANPNISASGYIYGKVQGIAVSTGASTLLGSVPASHVYKVNSLLVSNINGTAAADVTVTLYDSSAATTYYIAYTISVPNDSTLALISKDTGIYLEESDYIQIYASAASYLHAIISYEDIY